MRRLTTLFVALLALLVLPFNGMAEEVTFDFQNNNGNWPVGEGANYADGNVTTLTMDGVTLTGIQGESMNPVRIMRNNSRGVCLWIYKNTAVKFTAPEGKAVVSIVPTMQSGTFDLAASNGTVNEGSWTGNATEVTFGPNANSTRYIWAFTVTTADENEETVKPAAYDLEAATIADFNAAEDGKIVKLTLDNARVNGYWDLQAAYFVEDASGATVIKGTELTKATVLSGAIVGTKATNSEIDYMNTPAVAVEYQMNVTDATGVEATATTLTGTVMSITDACAQANYGKLITLENVSISGAGQNKTLTDADNNTMKARDYMGVLSSEFVWPEKASKITGILVYYMTGWFLMPVSEEAIVAAGTQPTEVTFNFADPNFREDIGEKLADVKGNIYNETFTVDGVTLQVTAGSAASKLYKDEKIGQNLVTYKDYATLTFRAPEDMAISQIAFTLAKGNLNLTTTAGSISETTWTGNAEGVRFAASGTTNLTNAVVTLVVKSDETTALPEIEYTECADIAAFNALASGTYAKVTLTDAEVTGISADGYSTAWIQDATGGCWIQYCSLIANLKESTKVNGTVYVVARANSGNMQMKDAEGTPNSELTAAEITDYTVVEGTLAEVNVVANKNKVVKISGASFVATGDNKGTLTQGESSIAVNNGNETANQQLHKLAGGWTKDVTAYSNVTIVGILVGNSSKDDTVMQLLPLSMEGSDVTSVESVRVSNQNDNTVYSLQGIQLNGMKKGLNIVGGKKIVKK